MYGPPSWFPLHEFFGVLCCLHYHILNSHCSTICLWWCPSCPKLPTGLCLEPNIMLADMKRGCWKDRLRVAKNEGRAWMGQGSRLSWWTAPLFWTQGFGCLLEWFMLLLCPCPLWVQLCSWGRLRSMFVPPLRWQKCARAHVSCFHTLSLFILKIALWGKVVDVVFPSWKCGNWNADNLPYSCNWQNSGAGNQNICWLQVNAFNLHNIYVIALIHEVRICVFAHSLKSVTTRSIPVALWWSFTDVHRVTKNLSHLMSTFYFFLM